MSGTILGSVFMAPRQHLIRRFSRRPHSCASSSTRPGAAPGGGGPPGTAGSRSEERRVGKECRSRGSADRSKENEHDREGNLSRVPLVVVAAGRVLRAFSLWLIVAALDC